MWTCVQLQTAIKILFKRAFRAVNSSKYSKSTRRIILFAAGSTAEGFVCCAMTAQGVWCIQSLQSVDRKESIFRHLFDDGCQNHAIWQLNKIQIFLWIYYIPSYKKAVCSWWLLLAKKFNILHHWTEWFILYTAAKEREFLFVWPANRLMDIVWLLVVTKSWHDQSVYVDSELKNEKMLFTKIKNSSGFRLELWLSRTAFIHYGKLQGKITYFIAEESPCTYMRISNMPVLLIISKKSGAEKNWWKWRQGVSQGRCIVFFSTYREE